MDLDWIEDFLALVEAQNFSRAAQTRHVTQPAFSRRIQSLEAWVGAPLFRRDPRRAVLTSAGEQFRGSAETLVRAAREGRAAALDAAGRAQTALAIAATHALSFTFFPGWVRARAPLAALGALNLMSDSMEACEEMMLRGEASFLLCHRHSDAPGRLESRSFRRVQIGADALAPVCAAKTDGAPLWPLSSPDPVPYLAYAQPSGLGRILEADWRRRGLEFALKPAMTARLAAALMRMAQDGLGVAWLPRSLAADALARGDLVEAGPRGIATPVEIVLYRPAARLGRAAETFWEGLAQPVL